MRRLPRRGLFYPVRFSPTRRFALIRALSFEKKIIIVTVRTGHCYLRKADHTTVTGIVAEEGLGLGLF